MVVSALAGRKKDQESENALSELNQHLDEGWDNLALRKRRSSGVSGKVLVSGFAGARGELLA